MIPQAASGIGSQGNQLLVSDVETTESKGYPILTSGEMMPSKNNQSMYIACCIPKLFISI